METGNLKISKICQMEINTIGHDCFTDIDTFRPSKGNPDWSNFKEKIKTEKDINMENVLRERDRIKLIREETIWLINDNAELKKIKAIIHKYPCRDKNYYDNTINDLIINYPLQAEWIESIQDYKKTLETANKQIHEYKEKLFVKLKKTDVPESKNRISEIEKNNVEIKTGFLNQYNADICILKEILQPYHLPEDEVSICNSIVCCKDNEAIREFRQEIYNKAKDGEHSEKYLKKIEEINKKFSDDKEFINNIKLPLHLSPDEIKEINTILKNYNNIYNKLDIYDFGKNYIKFFFPSEDLKCIKPLYDEESNRFSALIREGSKFEKITAFRKNFLTDFWVKDTVKKILLHSDEKQKKIFLERIKNKIKIRILQKNLNECNSHQINIIRSRDLAEHFITDFYSNLKKNISEKLPCNLEQSKTVKLTLLRTIKKSISNNHDTSGFHDTAISALECYFKKNSKGIFEPSLEHTNKDIKQAFKNKNKQISDLCRLVDTKKGNSLKNTSTTWKTVKKILTEKDSEGCEILVFMDLDKPDLYQYKTSLFTFMQLRNFYEVLTEFITPLELSQIIEVSIKYLNFRKNKMTTYPVPSNSAEYFFYIPQEEPDIEDTLFYDRKNPEDMKEVLDWPHKKKYIDTIVSETEKYCIHNYFCKSEKYDKKAVLFFIETMCSEQKIGKSSDFFFKWAMARVSFGEYKKKLCEDLSKASDKYLEAFECGLYYAGPHIKDFCQEAIEVFILQWKKDKKVNRIKEIYGFSSSLGITLKLYNAFKESDFNDYSIIHPYQCILDLWDMGCDLAAISEFTGLPWQYVKQILTDNIKYLKRQDEDAINEMKNSYFSKWDCDELGIDTLEEFHD